ncbi:hypothetical protein Tco_0149228 [Tanacetum coccineum]
MSNNILHVHPTQAPKSSTQDLQYQLYLIMKDDEKLRNDDLWWSLKIKFEKPATPTAPLDESSSEQVMDQEPNPSGLGTQEQLDEFDAWMDDFGTDDDEVPTEEVSQELLEEISWEVDEAQLQKVVNEMLRQRCNSGEEHLCQREPKAPPMTLLNQDLFYLRHANSGSKKYTLSLHKYPTVSFPENDFEELTTRWEKQKDKPEEVYSDLNLVEVIRTSYELGHEHKFITEIVVRRANGKIDPIT